MSAYSAKPSRSGWGSKVPIQPRSLGDLPGRDERVFHVTKRGLVAGLNEVYIARDRGGIHTIGRQGT